MSLKSREQTVLASDQFRTIDQAHQLTGLAVGLLILATHEASHAPRLVPVQVQLRFTDFDAHVMVMHHSAVLT